MPWPISEHETEDVYWVVQYSQHHDGPWKDMISYLTEDDAHKIYSSGKDLFSGRFLRVIRRYILDRDVTPDPEDL